MFSKLLIFTTATIVAVNAQGATTASSSITASSAASVPTDIPGLSACIIACITPAASQNGCSGITDVNCVCTSAQFQADAGACLQQHCTTADLQAALQLQNAECAAASLSATGSVAPKSVSFTLASSSTATSAASASSSKTVTTPNGSSTASSSSTATSSSITTPGLSTTTPTVSNVASPHSANISTGALIGAVIGAVIPVLFIMAFFIWYFRRRAINLKRSIETEREQKILMASSLDGAQVNYRALPSTTVQLPCRDVHNCTVCTVCTVAAR